MKRIFILTLAAMLAAMSAVSAGELSQWAEKSYSSANSAGMIPLSVAANKMTGNITRIEFCEMVMNMYRGMGAQGAQNVECTFTDTDNASAAEAHALGIIDGRSETEFCPDDLITRQEMAKILMKAVNKADKDAHVTAEELEKICKYEDFGETDDWAAADVAKSIKYKILNGVGGNCILPKGYATREQAIATVTRTTDAFADEAKYYGAPEITNLYDGMSVTDEIEVKWSDTEDAQSYAVIVKDEKYEPVQVRTVTKSGVKLNTQNMQYNKNYTITVGAVLDENIVVYSEPVSIFYGTEQEIIHLPSSIEDKYNRVFPNGVPFATEEEAEYNMALATFPVWKIKENGEKYSSTASILVNRNLVSEVEKIFTEIYNDAEQFPIKDVGGYNWRTTAGSNSVSQHSYGTCIDINYDENYYCYAATGEAITGSFWKPGENPYSITETGSVVRAFAKYGWQWGGNAWTTLRDYMHFTYLGK